MKYNLHVHNMNKRHLVNKVKPITTEENRTRQKMISTVISFRHVTKLVKYKSYEALTSAHAIRLLYIVLDCQLKLLRQISICCAAGSLLDIY